MHGAILHPQVIVTLVAEDREITGAYVIDDGSANRFVESGLQLLGRLPVVANEHSDSAKNFSGLNSLKCLYRSTRKGSQTNLIARCSRAPILAHDGTSRQSEESATVLTEALE